MNHRIATLLASESATLAATKTLDINVNKPISRITIQMKGTNNGSVPTAHPQNMLTKIEIVDGSNVLFSLSGLQARALNYYDRGLLPYSILEYRNDVMCSAIAEINFGRHLWDEILAFDPLKFSNPQLKITHNLAAGGSAPDAATLNVFAHMFDEKVPAPVGFLLSKEQYSYPLVASAQQAIDLATDLPYRALMISSLTSGKQPWENYNKIKLSEDNDNRVIINNESTSDLIKLLQQYPLIMEQIFCLDLDGTETIYCTPTYAQAVAMLGMSANDASMFCTQGSGGTFDATGDADEHSQLHVTGLLPHGALLIPFGDQKTLEDWYDVSKVGSLRMTITGGSGASGTVNVVSQQIKRYASA